MKEVKIYTTTSCGFCARAKDFLRSKGVAYEEIDVTGDDAMRAQLVEMSGGRKTVPQVFIGGQPVGGYTDLVQLEREEKLNSMLA